MIVRANGNTEDFTAFKREKKTHIPAENQFLCTRRFLGIMDDAVDLSVGWPVCCLTEIFQLLLDGLP